MSLGNMIRRAVIGGLLLTTCLAGFPLCAQEAVARKVKTQAAPNYPELARRMNITGVVKIEVKVDKNGTIKDTKILGGHPVLANAALDALKKWKYEAGPVETIGVVEFRFSPNQ